MALIIEPRSQDRRGFAGGLETGLEMLIQNRMQNVLQGEQRKNTARGLESLGFSPEQSQELSMLPGQSLNEIIKDRLAQPKREAFAGALSSLLGGPPSPQVGAEGIAPQVSGVEEGGEGIISPQVAPTRPQVDFSGLTERQALDLAKLQSEQQKIASKERSTELKLEGAEKKELRKEEFKERREDRKETLDYYKETNKKARSAKKDIRRLERMVQLVKEGDLTSPGVSGLISSLSSKIWGVGLNLEFLRNPSDTEFEQLSNSFVEGAKEMFGGRITDADLRAFFKTIPTLLQTRGGALKIMESMKRTNDGKVLRQKIMREVIRKNGGRRPANIEELVDDKLDPTLDKWAEDFREISKEVQFNKKVARIRKESAPWEAVGLAGPPKNLPWMFKPWRTRT